LLIIDDWLDHDRTETSSDPIQLVAGQRYPIVVEGYENGGEAEWQFYWESASTTREIVPQRVLYPAVKVQDYPASEPVPADGAVFKDTWLSIEWTAGPAAVSHDVYFGDSYDDVAATSDTLVATAQQIAITAPYWVKLERDVAGNFRGYYSANGSTWQQMSWNPRNVSMSSNVYIGLAVTSHNTSAICEAVFSNVMITDAVGTQWTSQDIGMLSNDAEPMYIAVSNSTGTPAVVYHDDPAAATIDTWTEWIIPLQTFADQGIVLTDVDRIAIGLGTKGNMTIPGGSGKMFFDDIRLYRPREAAE